MFKGPQMSFTKKLKITDEESHGIVHIVHFLF